MQLRANINGLQHAGDGCLLSNQTNKIVSSREIDLITSDYSYYWPYGAGFRQKSHSFRYELSFFKTCQK